MAKFFIDADGNLSTTKIMNLIFFILAVLLPVIGVIVGLIWSKQIDSNIYIYVGGITGGSFLQYSYGKTVSRKSNDTGVSFKYQEPKK